MQGEMQMKEYTKVTVYIKNFHYEDERINDEKKIARLIKNHIAHLGESIVYYEKRDENLSLCKRLLRAMGG